MEALQYIDSMEVKHSECVKAYIESDPLKCGKMLGFLSKHGCCGAIPEDKAHEAVGGANQRPTDVNKQSFLEVVTNVLKSNDKSSSSKDDKEEEEPIVDKRGKKRKSRICNSMVAR